jgi:NADPH-dependent 2,4-dienoyl-CoA reductase/sulfur reductase-like enzyme
MHGLDLSFDILIVGAGPAGLAAACCAAERDLRIGVVDDNPDVGGQIWRNERAKPSSKEAALWMDRIRRARFEFLPGTQIIAQDSPGCLIADHVGQRCELRHQKLILATGARELFLPFPGWTLPNVMGAGGLQALVKGGLPIEGKRVAVAGSGPLLLAVADYLHHHGAKVLLVAEQAPHLRLVRFATSLFRQTAKLRQALALKWRLRRVKYVSDCWPCKAEGTDKLESVTFTTGARTWQVACDYLACGFGLVPNLELPALLGCEVTDRGVRVDNFQRTSVPDVYCAGETTGIGGLDLALVEGQIAGHAAAGREDKASLLFCARAKARQFAEALERAFALRPSLCNLATSETIFCRCEDVPYGEVSQYANWVEAKLQSRCGMGPCQGRICGPITQLLFKWPRPSVRPPLFSTGLENLSKKSS